MATLWGVRWYADFIDHLGIPRAVLASRLKTLTAAGVLTRVAGERHLEYELTGKGAALWPVGLSLMTWVDDYCASGGPRRLFRHAADGGESDYRSSPRNRLGSGGMIRPRAGCPAVARAGEMMAACRRRTTSR